MKQLIMTIYFFMASLVVFGQVGSPEKGEEEGILFDGKVCYKVDWPNKKIEPQSFSVSSWVLVHSNTTSQIFLNIGAANSDFTFYLYNGQVRMLIQKEEQGNVYDYVLAPPPEPNRWTHYCGTFDGKTVSIYKDGVLAGQKPLKTSLKYFKGSLFLGTLKNDSNRILHGVLRDIGIWNKALTSGEVNKIYTGSVAGISDRLIAAWNGDSVRGEKLVSSVIGPNGPNGEKYFPGVNTLLNKKDTGFRSIWYYNQKLKNEYIYKYSGGLGTYPANHYPFAVYCPEVDKTFFCFGGTDEETESTLYHEVACFDHKTKMVSRPTIILDKKTEDAHDNPVMTVDNQGYLWIFSTSHGTGRPSWIHKSVRPYNCDEFVLVEPTKIVAGREVPMTNFSYLQVFTVPCNGMISLFTTYDRSLLNDPTSIASRVLCFMKSSDGVHWSAWQPIAAIKYGHYQNAAIYKDQKIGTSFNYHPNDEKEGRIGLNWRTNLYYIESKDGGKTWQSIQGDPISIPIKEISSPSLVYNYEAKRQNVYIMDMTYDNEGNPVIFYITSKGFESGPENGPRVAWTAHWSGTKWDIQPLCEVDNNYDFGSIYVEPDGLWRMIGALDDGPQRYNTGGEMSLWISRDQGHTWMKERQMTQSSSVNHCYPRRPINANPDFYSYWANGNGRKKSQANLFFSNQQGDVFQLPRKMKNDWEKPVPIQDR